MTYVVLALKWRPQTFDQVAGQEAIASTLRNAILTERTAHAYLFTGPRGVGKTSTARILAKALNCVKGPTPDPCNQCDPCKEITTGRSLDVLEIDGASNRGIDDIRELRESVRYAPASGRVKVYIIDEVHMLTTDAFNALLKTLEEPPGHVVFVLATTEPLKVPATIVSRCQRYDFSRLRLRDTVARMETICKEEQIEISDDALSLIGRRAEGSMRDALTLLDQVIASGRSPIDGTAVAEALGIAGRDLYFSISEAILEQDASSALSLLGTAYGEGQNLQEVAEELVAHLRNLLILSVDEKMRDLVDATDVERDRYRTQAGRMKPADLVRQLHIAIDAAARMRRSAFPRVLLEVAVAEICLMPRAADLTDWLRKLPSEGAEIAGQDLPASSSGGTKRARKGKGSATLSSEIDPAARADAPQPTTPVGATDLDPSGPTSDWHDVVRKVRSRRPALAASLDGTEVTGEEGGYLMIRFPESKARFGSVILERGENRPVLQEAIREVYGRPVGWRISKGPSPGPLGAGEPDVAPRAPEASKQVRSNLSDIQRIADRMDGEILGPS
jgi:DNA polymerase-3 subunit gamma/tau